MANTWWKLGRGGDGVTTARVLLLLVGVVAVAFVLVDSRLNPVCAGQNGDQGPDPTLLNSTDVVNLVLEGRIIDLDDRCVPGRIATVEVTDVLASITGERTAGGDTYVEHPPVVVGDVLDIRVLTQPFEVGDTYEFWMDSYRLAIRNLPLTFQSRLVTRDGVPIEGTAPGVVGDIDDLTDGADGDVALDVLGEAVLRKVNLRGFFDGTRVTGSNAAMLAVLRDRLAGVLDVEGSGRP